MLSKKQTMLWILVILLDSFNKAICSSKLGKVMIRVLQDRFNTAEVINNATNILNRQLKRDELNNLRMIYENGKKAVLHQNQNYIEIEKEFTILTYKNVTGKLMSYNINGHTTLDDIKKELLYKGFDIFGPVIFNTSIKDKIDIDISHYILPSFKNSVGAEINQINLIDNDTYIFKDLLCNGIISEIKSQTLYITGLKHYSDELEHLQKLKRKQMPLIKKIIF